MVGGCCAQDHLFLFIQTFLARDSEHETVDTLALLCYSNQKQMPNASMLRWRAQNKSIPNSDSEQNPFVRLRRKWSNRSQASFHSYHGKTPFHLMEAMPLSIIISRQRTHNT